VRPSNSRAIRLYQRSGFKRIGMRRRYYPSFENTREDAIVMRRMIDDQ
jgi:ribosomal-protein-alanine N-acetyltransferase